MTKNNRAVWYILSWSLIGCCCVVYGEYGCMDRSLHLDQLNDPKMYHYVTGADGGPCSCPCSRYDGAHKNSVKLGKCKVCNHYRVRRPYTIVKKAQEQSKNSAKNEIINNQLARLFKRH